MEEEFANWYLSQWPNAPTASSPTTASVPNVTNSSSAAATIKVFEKRFGEYYQCFGSDALRVSDEFFKTRAVVRWLSTGSVGGATAVRLPYVSLNPKKLTAVIKQVVMIKRQNLELWRKEGGSGLHHNDSDEGGDGDEMDDEDRPITASAAASSSSGSQGWQLLKRVTPGSIDGISQLVGFPLTSPTDSVSACVKLSSDTSHTSRVLGMAFVDSGIRTITLCEIIDDANFSQLERALLQQGVKEIFFLGNEQAMVDKDDVRKIKQLLQDCKIPLQQTSGKGKQESTSEDSIASISSGAGPLPPSTLADLADLTRLFSPTSPLSIESPLVLQTRKNALSAMQFLLKALDISTDEHSAAASSSVQYTLLDFRLSDICRLDAAAFEALTLFPRVEDGERNISLFGVLDKSKSAMGSRLLANWIRQPLTDAQQIISRQEYVELFYTHTSLRDQLRDQLLTSMPDLHRLASRFHRSKASLDEVMLLYQFACVRLPQIRDALIEFCGTNSSYQPTQPHVAAARSAPSHPPSESSATQALPLLQRIQRDFINPLEQHFGLLKPFANMVEQAILVEEYVSHRHKRLHYLINPAIHEVLKEIAERRTAAKKMLFDEMETIVSAVNAESKGSVQPKPHCGEPPSRFVGWHLRLTKTEVKKWNGGVNMGLPQGSSSVKFLESRKDGYHFTTHRLEKLSQQFQIVSQEFEEASAQLTQDVLKTTATYTPLLAALSDIVAHLDVFSTLAFVAFQSPDSWIRPAILPMGSGVVRIEKARHACMELLSHGKGGNFIPNDVEMEIGKSHLCFVTGLNSGGKSTYIRTAALNVLMAQMGSMIPASSATISVVDAILSRVGAGDNIQRAQSTFMVEMLEAASILQLATRDSFVLIDELGRGTSVDDGYGLAYAIAEHLARNIRCFTFFATHYFELTLMEKEVPGVVNSHVCVHESDQALTLLYTIAPGASDRSYGIHAAKLAGFPTAIVDDASEKAKMLEHWQTADEKSTTAENVPAASQEELNLFDSFLNSFPNLAHLQSLTDEQLQEHWQTFQNEIASAACAMEVDPK